MCILADLEIACSSWHCWCAPFLGWICIQISYQHFSIFHQDVINSSSIVYLQINFNKEVFLIVMGRMLFVLINWIILLTGTYEWFLIPFCMNLRLTWMAVRYQLKMIAFVLRVKRIMLINCRHHHHFCTPYHSSN